MNTLQNLILSNEDETLNREVKAYQEKLTFKNKRNPNMGKTMVDD